MLNHDNLARHTLHHQELDYKRDFVQEYLESLDPSAVPEQDAPEQDLSLQRTVSVPVSSLMVKGSGGAENSKTSQPRQRHHHHHLHHNHNHHSNQDKDKKGRQHDLNVPSSPMDGINNLSANARASTRIESEVPKHSPRKKVKSQLDNPNTNDNVKRKDASKARQDNAKHEKRRKKQMDVVELDVEKLDINKPHYDVHHTLQQEPDQPERVTRTTTAPVKAKPTASSRKRANKSKRRHDDLHDKQSSEQPQSDERQGSRHRHRPSLEDPENNLHASDKATHLNNHTHCNSNSNNRANNIHKHNNIININNPTDKYNHNHKNHNHNNSSKHNNNKSTHHLVMDTAYANNEDKDGKELGKKDSKKPRKILTQDSLVLNQFASANTTKDRITLPKASSLGLFQKGKASRKIAVKDHAHGFSETNFLGRTAATPTSEGSHDRRREEVVTSSYFAKPKDREPKDTVPSPLSESRSGHFTANENTTNTSVLSKHSIERRAQQYAGNVISRSTTHSGGLSPHSNDMPPQSTPKYSNELTTSTHQASIVSPLLLSPGRNSPEHTVDAILQELIPSDRYDNQPREDGQEYGRQGHISQDACLERQNYTRDGPMLLEQPFEAPTSSYVDTGQYFDMYGYPLEPQSNTRESSVQHFTAVSMANSGARNMYYEWHLEPVYGWPNSGAGYQGYTYNNQGRAASHPGASVYMQQEDSTQFGHDWHGQQGNQQGNQTSNNQAHFEWRPHRLY